MPPNVITITFTSIFNHINCHANKLAGLVTLSLNVIFPECLTSSF